MHRGDSDWHGWPLQPIVDQIAEKRYAELRESWPAAIDAPDTLAEFAKRGYQASEMARQIREATLGHVVEVLDVLNGMPHPFVTEIEGSLAEYDAALERREHGGVAQDKWYRKVRFEILPRYTNQEDA